ncbi:MAG TPA: class I SAM-dependent methyltransferase, partial [Chloroflexia bacterium]|nr:class I SAM-dependent methyltransferase [Chloroflexia bacterium]
MGGDQYDPGYVRAYYDTYGEREWTRLAEGPTSRLNFHIHQHYLQHYIRPGDHVLEAGAGPGRFTIELAACGARTTVGDISPVQLALNAEKVAAAGCESSVVERRLLDIADLAGFPTGGYDAVVCYGGPLSYVFDRADAAVAEMLRVTKPGGVLLLSVMSLLGTTRAFLAGVLATTRQFGIPANDAVVRTGDLHAGISPHRCHMYRWSELEALLARHPCTLLAASASGWSTLGNDATLQAT